MCLYVHSGLQIGVLRCNNFSGDQVFMLTEANEIRKDKACVTFNKDNAFVDLKFCNKFHTQEFAYNNQVCFALYIFFKYFFVIPFLPFLYRPKHLSTTIVLIA